MSAALAPDVQRLLEESAEWRLLGMLFEYPAGRWRANLEALLPSLPRPDLRAMAEAALEQFTEGLQIALFGPAGSVPVREVTYQGGVQHGYLMAELSAFYEAFAYQPEAEEAADHLAIEAGFVAYLKLKQAHAAAAGDSGAAQVTAEAAAEFIKNHIAVQAEPVLRALENFAPEFLIEAGRLLAKYAGPSPRSGFPLSAGFDEDELMSCGPSSANEELIQLEAEG